MAFKPNNNNNNNLILEINFILQDFEKYVIL